MQLWRDNKTAAKEWAAVGLCGKRAQILEFFFLHFGPVSSTRSGGAGGRQCFWRSRDAVGGDALSIQAPDREPEWPLATTDRAVLFC